MAGVIREVPLPGDVWELARRLRGAQGLAILHGDARGALSEADVRTSFLACDPVEESEAWIPDEPSVPNAANLHEHEVARAAGWAGGAAAPRWIGVIPYEAGRELERKSWIGKPDRRAAPSIERPRWLRYDAVARIDRASGRVAIEADSDRAAARLLRRLEGPSRPFGAAELRAIAAHVEPDEAHVARVREVLRYIAQGDVYQVNVARLLRFGVSGDALALFARMFAAAPAPYAMFAELGGVTVCASSPELALEVRGDVLRTGPIKGTRPRGRDARSDEALARELDADPKERAELTMAIDLHRNDLGRVAVPGSVRVVAPPKVLGGRTVWSRAAEIVARRAPSASLEAIACAMIPCGSVTGAPKVRAMEIIAELEPHRRGLYTGAFGYVGRDGGVTLAMAIRTLQLVGHEALYFSGGGIVADSDPARELEETRWKSAQILSMLAERDGVGSPLLDRSPLRSPSLVSAPGVR